MALDDPSLAATTSCSRIDEPKLDRRFLDYFIRNSDVP